MELSFGIVSSLIVGWILAVILSVFIHFFGIEILSSRPKYLRWGILRGVFAILYFASFYFLSLWEWIPLSVFQASSHFVIFNPLLNKLRSIKYRELMKVYPEPVIEDKYPFWYLGKLSGWMDKLLLRLGPTFYQSFYYACCGVAVISLVSIYIRYTT